MNEGFVLMLFIVAEIVVLLAYFGWEAFRNKKRRLLEWKQAVLTHHWDSPDVEPFMAGGCPVCGKRPE